MESSWEIIKANIESCCKYYFGCFVSAPCKCANWCPQLSGEQNSDYIMCSIHTHIHRYTHIHTHTDKHRI